jgi:3alpha(or 20beta)-hydroxysteroid dehydrogenase
MARVSGKVAIITGAARGMGAATARLFIHEGATVILTDVLDTEGRALAGELGPAASFRRHDVSSEASWNALVADTNDRFGRIDVLVNNAGILHFATLLETSLEDFQRVISVNLTGTFLGIKTAGHAMIQQGGGAIVNIASIDGISGANAVGAYCASKFGVRGLTKVAALELGHRGVRVNAVLPGGIDTPMANPSGAPPEALTHFFAGVPQQRVGQPAEVAHATLFLASDDASYINGAELGVDGGWAAGHYYHGFPGAPGV